MRTTGTRNPIAPRCGLALAAILVLSPASNRAVAQPGPAPVSVSTVIQRDVPTTRTYVGTVMPSRRSTIGSAVDGRVIKFLVNEGQAVKAREPLAQLRTDLLEIERAAALAEERLRESELEEAKNGSRTEEVAESKARLAAAEAIATYNLAKLKRIQRLAENGTITNDELEETLAGSVQSQRLAEAARQSLRLVEAGPRKERIAGAEARVAAAREEVRRIENQIERHTIVSPFAGFVVAEHTEQGEWLTRGQSVATIAELSEVEIEIPVLENDVPALRLGTEAIVQLAAFPGRAFSDARVSRIIPQADLRSRTFPVKISLKNTVTGDGPLIKAGMFARVGLAIGKTDQGMLVPKDAIVLGGRTPILQVVEFADKTSEAKPGAGGTVRSVPVTLGAAWKSSVTVSGKIKAGDVIVTMGNERLQNGQEVVIKRVEGIGE